MAKPTAESKNAGYILIHRRLKDHWIWQDPCKLKWWVDILMECNHSEKKVQLGYLLLTCKRGESLNSLKTWSKQWRVNVNTVRRFLKMLENDNMIVIKSEQKTTRLTVCNYDTYNSFRHAKDTQETRKRNDSVTRRDTNNTQLNTQLNAVGSEAAEISINYKIWTKDDFLKSLEKYKDKFPREMILEFSRYWREPDPSGKMKFQLMKTWHTGGRLARWKKKDDEKVFQPFAKNGQQVSSPVITDEIKNNREFINSLTNS